ncbi:MAG: C-terminal helicase domain-containing protein, partial [Rhodococcus sp.]|nr:C-terminal helicase domain-containing protein [Rhodococcus sp. (in: high G+C Gram-positive bacteria)]
MDIYRQLTLFLDDREHGLPIEPVSLDGYFNNARKWLEYEQYVGEFQEHRRRPNETTAPKPRKEPPGPRARIETVLAHVFIRRRRRDVRELYGESAEVKGHPIRFPDPLLENVEYRLDRVYSQAGAFRQITNKLGQYEASRYRALLYLPEQQRGHSRYAGVLRSGDRIAVLMKALLLKRLESSVAAFRSTLESLLRSNRHFRQALEAGYVPVGEIATRLLNGQSFDAEEAFEILNQEDDLNTRVRAFPTDDFDTKRWIRDLDADHYLLQDLLERVQTITPEDDDKLRALKQFLARPDVSAGKVLIFSEAETTIDYLYDHLNPRGERPEIARLTGSNRDQTESIVARFSPKSNLSSGSRRSGSEIRILLATDVISEGQNLQDCARVLNYDLHWNPVRLIQRFGRVDRIGTEHEYINLHSMWPDIDVDADLDLTGRLHGRIQLFHDLIGLDNRLLSEAEQLNADAMYRIYGERQLPESDDGLDEVSVHQRAVAKLQRIREEQPDLWESIKNIPDGIRSALSARSTKSATPVASSVFLSSNPQDEVMQPTLLSPENLRSMTRTPFADPVTGETLVLLGSGEVNSCYAVGDDLQARPISPAQFIAHAECEVDTPA